MEKLQKMIWVPKSAFELSGRVLQNNAHITPQVIARALFNMYEITYIRRPQTVNRLERDHSDFTANSKLHQPQCRASSTGVI